MFLHQHNVKGTIDHVFLIPGSVKEEFLGFLFARTVQQHESLCFYYLEL